ncbi:glycosyltransferase [Gelidibacter algens]|uniref:Glycosyltransferase n=1 Tax=Gelidibacter algens TaxID=49280 RepID=A0A1A7R228_9FLAO|nr:glycosyltransferase family 2 protein [Gelidibacter algens]OBX25534.1 glycosyl transferase [Gelidibacter algens]RAJ22263.1 glycosyltransferase [Gelidibacter algens]
MKITIITATYNSARTLEVCMDSVLQQTFKEIEYIIIDGGSTDGTLDVISSKAKNNLNIVYSSEPDKGIYDALNKGIAKATGDVIGFVHSDDFLADHQVILKIAEAFETDDVDGVYGNLHYVQFDDTEKIVRNWISQPFLPKLLTRGWMPAHPTLFLKSEVYRNYGQFNLEYRIAADYDFVLRVFQQAHHKFTYLPLTITKMRVGGASNRSLKNLVQKTREDYKALITNKIGFPIKVVLHKNLSKLPQWFTK